MKQEGYVDSENNTIDNKKNAKGLLIKLGIIVGCIVVIIIVVFAIINASKNKECSAIENSVITALDNYLEDYDLVPSLKGDSVTVSLDDLYNNGYLDSSNTTYKEETCTGSIKATKHDDELLYSYDLSGCGICSTDSRYGEWSKKESDKMPNIKRNLVDVIAYYNCYKKSVNYTEWTSFIPSDKVSKEETDGVLLPLDSKKLPKVPEQAKELKYEVETATYYSYRDIKYKFYKDNGGSYSGFYSEKPASYSTKDTATLKYTEWSEWSTNYPDKKDYRSIERRTGYKWYYLNSEKKKVYWKNGSYYPEAPDDKYVEKDAKGDTVKMYRYRDKTWRWYNGAKRNYSGYSSTKPNSYTSMDSELYTYTSWSSYKPESKLDSTNSYYREERTDTYYRYRAKYALYTDLLFQENVNKQVFESKMGMTIEQVMEDDNYALDVKYKYISRKRK